MLLGGNSYHFTLQKLCFYNVKRHLLPKKQRQNMPFYVFEEYQRMAHPVKIVLRPFPAMQPLLQCCSPPHPFSALRNEFSWQRKFRTI